MDSDQHIFFLFEKPEGPDQFEQAQKSSKLGEATDFNERDEALL